MKTSDLNAKYDSWIATAILCRTIAMCICNTTDIRRILHFPPHFTLYLVRLLCCLAIDIALHSALLLSSHFTPFSPLYSFVPHPYHPTIYRRCCDVAAMNLPMDICLRKQPMLVWTVGQYELLIIYDSSTRRLIIILRPSGGYWLYLTECTTWNCNCARACQATEERRCCYNSLYCFLCNVITVRNLFIF